ncbi:MAG: hypothetical protein U0V18_13125 [Anaerolineales bacterium]
MRIDEMIEKLMLIFTFLPVYWFIKLGYWAWFAPDMLEKVLRHFQQHPSNKATGYFDNKSDIRTFRIVFILLVGLFLAIGLLIISSLIMEKFQ